MNNLKPYTKYKPSNIAWLGDIPEHWEVSRLKYLADCFPSNVDKHSREGETQVRLCNYTDVYKNDFISDKMKFMVATASNEQIQKFTLLKDDVIITKDSETSNDIAVPAIVTESLTNVICGYHLSVIRANNDVYAKYLFRLFQHKKFNSQFEICSNGVTRVGLGVYDLVNAFGIKPSYSEQIAIANFLDYKLSKIDRFIQKKKQLIKLLNEQKAGIINDTVTKGLNLNAKMKPSGIEWLGDIPEHWDSVKTKNVFKLVTEVAPPNNTEVLLSIYTQYGVKPRTEFEERGNRATTTDNYWIVKKQDIIVNKLLAWMGAIGISEYDGVTSPAYDILRSKGKADPYFYHYLFRSPIAFTEFKRHSRGIMDVRLRLYFSEFGNIKLPVPPLEEQKAIVQHIEQETAQINTVIQTIEKEIALTQEYRVALIAEAVTGKIDVRAYEIPETPVMELYEELEDEMSLAAEEEVGYLTEN